MKIKKWYGKIKAKFFNWQLEKERKKAEKLYEEKGDTVVCKYCGNLMPKKEAGVIYDFKNKELELFHESCFEKNEHIGTLEELEMNNE